MSAAVASCPAAVTLPTHACGFRKAAQHAFGAPIYIGIACMDLSFFVLFQCLCTASAGYRRLGGKSRYISFVCFVYIVERVCSYTSLYIFI